MDEAIEIARVFYGTPDLFPWVCLVLFCLVTLYNRKAISRYINARADYYISRKSSDAVQAEVIRNNTAALNNNTAALENNRVDRGETREMLRHHEQVSAERIQHVQEVVNRIDSTVTSNSKQIGLIEDRTDGR